MEKTLISKIFAKIKKTPKDITAYEDLFALCRNIEPEDFDLAHKTNKELRERVSVAIKKRYDIEGFFNLYKKTLLFDAPYFFDPYLLYLEINRRPSERFYQPRRKVLKRVVDALQKLTDDELDELFISMPPRVGKTTILMFFVTWLIGRDSEKSNLYSAYSDTITKAFYNGVLEIINDPVTYLWHDVFPNAKLVQTNSQDETINIDRKKRYPSLTCRSLYGTLNGACDCNGFEISDDLIGGIEEALNKDRLISAWSKVDNNLLPRAKEKAKILWCGTRWSMIDPAGLRMELLENDERFKNRRYEIINLSALDENDESQFDYDYEVGFSTDYYRMRRASFERNNDMASWNAQYRVFQRSLCDNYLTAEVSKSFIYDNCACQENKGTKFARERLKCHLQRYYRKHGTNGYVLKCDLSNYFGSTRHDIALAAIQKRVGDEWAVSEVERIIRSFNDGDDPEVGMGLGSQVTQLVELAVLDDLDHYIKEQLHIKHYIRYMDDFLLIHEDKGFLIECRKKIEERLAKLELHLSQKKTQVFPITQPIRFLGFSFRLTETGKVIMRLLPEKISHERRKLRKLVERAKAGILTREEADACFTSWKAHAEQGDTYNLIRKMTTFYQELWR